MLNSFVQIILERVSPHFRLVRVSEAESGSDCAVFGPLENLCYSFTSLVANLFLKLPNLSSWRTVMVTHWQFWYILDSKVDNSLQLLLLTAVALILTPRPSLLSCLTHKFEFTNSVFLLVFGSSDPDPAIEINADLVITNKRKIRYRFILEKLQTLFVKWLLF